MNKIGFIGAYDKADVIMYTAKALVEMGKKVLIIDSTINQRTKYIVPSISPSSAYITDFEGIDISVGIYSLDAVANYLGVENINAYGYDYVLIDVDDSEMIERFDLYTAEKNYFVTAFDLYSLKRGMEILSPIRTTLDLTKVLFSKYMSREENEYLDYLSSGSRIRWADNRIYFPFESGDLSIIMENQRTNKLKVRNLSQAYRDALVQIVSEITNENPNVVKRIFKQRMS